MQSVPIHQFVLDIRYFDNREQVRNLSLIFFVQKTYRENLNKKCESLLKSQNRFMDQT